MITFTLILTVIQFMFIPYEYYKFQVVNPIERMEADYMIIPISRNLRAINYTDFITEIETCSSSAGYKILILGVGIGIQQILYTEEKLSVLSNYTGQEVVLMPLSDIRLFNLTTGNYILEGSKPINENDILLNYLYYERIPVGTKFWIDNNSIIINVSAIILDPLSDPPTVFLDDSIIFSLTPKTHEASNPSYLNKATMWKYYIKVLSPRDKLQEYQSVVEDCLSNSYGNDSIKILSKNYLLSDAYDRLKKHGVNPSSPTFYFLILGIILLFILSIKYVNDLVNSNSKMIAFMMVNGYPLKTIIKLLLLEVVLLVGFSSLLSLVGVSLYYVNVIIKTWSFPISFIIRWILKYFITVMSISMIISFATAEYVIRNKTMRVFINEVS